MRRPVYDPNWPAEVQEIWRNDMREMWDASIERHSYNSYQNQLAFYAAIVDRYAAQTILDVGCAQATLAMMLAERGKRVTAVDIRQPFLDYAGTRYERGELRLLAANVVERPVLGEFDLVFGNQIIEHLVYPAEFMRSLAHYARPGGIIVITTPNHDYFRSSLPSFTDLGDVTRYEHLQFSASGADHFFAYTPEELRDAARTAGLQVMETVWFETPWISGHAFIRFLHPFTPLAVLRALDRLTLRIVPRKAAHQLCVVLRKQP